MTFYNFALVCVMVELTNRNPGCEQGIFRDEGLPRQRSHRSHGPDVRSEQLVHGMRLRQVPEYSHLESLDRGVRHRVVNYPLSN